jgi:hypothetical protein
LDSRQEEKKKAITSMGMKKIKPREAIDRERWATYLGEVDIEEERLLGIGDLNPVLLVNIIQIHVSHSLGDFFHRHRSSALLFRKSSPALTTLRYFSASSVCRPCS